MRLLNTDGDSWALPWRASIWVHPHTTASATESRGSVEQHWRRHSLKCWAGKVLGFLKTQHRQSKDNRRLRTLSQRLLQSRSGKACLQLQPWKLSRKIFVHHVWCVGPNVRSYTRHPVLTSQQGSLAYMGRCWAESVVRLTRVSDTSTEMTMRSSKWNPLQTFPVCRV